MYLKEIRSHTSYMGASAKRHPKRRFVLHQIRLLLHQGSTLLTQLHVGMSHHSYQVRLRLKKRKTRLAEILRTSVTGVNHVWRKDDISYGRQRPSNDTRLVFPTDGKNSNCRMERRCIVWKMGCYLSTTGPMTSMRTCSTASTILPRPKALHYEALCHAAR